MCNNLCSIIPWHTSLAPAGGIVVLEQDELRGGVAQYDHSPKPQWQQIAGAPSGINCLTNSCGRVPATSILKIMMINDR